MIHQAFDASSLYCIESYVLKLQSFDHKTKHLNIILLEDIEL